MAMAAPLRGLSTVSLFAADHAAARAWYTQFLGVEPYFEDRPDTCTGSRGRSIQ